MSSAAGRAGRRTVYGRKRGRRLRPGRRALLADVLPAYSFALPEPPARLDPLGLFGPGIREVWLEVGFGAGEHLAAQAEAHPEVGVIGCETYVDGVAGLLKLVADGGLENVRIFPDDARLVLDALLDASIGRAFVLFPDPWPKSRHRKRRFVSPATVAALARVIGDGAELRIATDDAQYCRWTLVHVLAQGSFEWQAQGPRDWRTRPADWPPTRYEAKSAAAGRPGFYLAFRRRPRPPNKP